MENKFYKEFSREGRNVCSVITIIISILSIIISTEKIIWFPIILIVNSIFEIIITKSFNKQEYNKVYNPYCKGVSSLEVAVSSVLLLYNICACFDNSSMLIEAVLIILVIMASLIGLIIMHLKFKNNKLKEQLDFSSGFYGAIGLAGMFFARIVFSRVSGKTALIVVEICIAIFTYVFLSIALESFYWYYVEKNKKLL